mmetsp:Transcript_124856/g.353395  ORF Transcript_124856/g.353395 Transcript_124856/m.353395 type:complete len:276 (+) Transcript_124856:124-951(+)
MSLPLSTAIAAFSVFLFFAFFSFSCFSDLPPLAGTGATSAPAAAPGAVVATAAGAGSSGAPAAAAARSAPPCGPAAAASAVAVPSAAAFEALRCCSLSRFLFAFSSARSLRCPSSSEFASRSFPATLAMVPCSLSFSSESTLQNADASWHLWYSSVFWCCSAWRAVRNSARRFSPICSPSSWFSVSSALHFRISMSPDGAFWSKRLASSSSRSWLICRSFSRAFWRSRSTSMLLAGSYRAPRTAARDTSPYAPRTLDAICLSWDSAASCSMSPAR